MDADQIYHGTIADFKKPMLIYCGNLKDFGKGFYLAKDYRHARNIAIQRKLNSNDKNSKPYIYVYSKRNLSNSGLNIKRFNEASEAWLDYVIRCRNMLQHEIYDVVIGPTADSNVQKQITDFYNKYKLKASKEIKQNFIKQLKTEVHGIQYCFCTQRAIDYIDKKFIRREITK